ncbi:hypothetical protein J8V17_21090, partial [Photorhabdus bodei]|nr:hypothetical protein [Photorhabdus bodei]
KKSCRSKMGETRPSESLVLCGLASPYKYDCLGADAPFVANMKTRKAVYFITGTVITRGKQASTYRRTL